MHVHRSNRKQCRDRGVVRWVVNTTKEKSAGLLPKAEYGSDLSNSAFETRSAAEAFSAILRKRSEVGVAGPQNKTFGDALDVWERDLGAKGIGQVTRTDAVSQVRNHVVGKWTLRGVAIEDVRLSTITYPLLKEELLRRGQVQNVDLARGGQVKLLQKFRAIFDVAVDERWIGTNPSTSISIDSAVEDRDEKAIDPVVFGRFKDGVPALLAALEIIDHDSVLPISTLLQTGIRGGELSTLSLDQVTTTNKKTKLKISRAWKRDGLVGKPKSGLTRYIVAGAKLGKELKAHAFKHQRRGGDFLFGDDGVRVIDRADLRRRWHQAQFAVRGWGFFRSGNVNNNPRGYSLVKLLKPITEFTAEEWQSFALGRRPTKRLSFTTTEAAAKHIRLTLFGLHDLRHLYASQLLHAGISLSRVAQRLGDKETTVQAHYAHYLPEDDEADLEDIAAIAAIV